MLKYILVDHMRKEIFFLIEREDAFKIIGSVNNSFWCEIFEIKNKNKKLILSDEDKIFLLNNFVGYNICCSVIEENQNEEM